MAFYLLGIYFGCTLLLSVSLYTASYILQCIPRLNTGERHKKFLLGSYVFLWYAISVTFTIFNKWMMTVWMGGFHFPIFSTCVHMFIKLIFTRVWYWYSDEVIHEISPELFWKVVFPIGLVTSLDIMLSNQAILYVSVSLYTILKTSVVIFTYFWGILFRVDAFRYDLLASIGIITFGLALTVWTNLTVQSSAVGILYCFLAAAFGSLRWTLTQVLIEEDPCSADCLVALYRFAPSAAYCILPFALLVDVPLYFSSDDFFYIHPLYLLYAIGLLACGGIIAFLLIYVEVLLVQLTSAVSLGVLGQLKEILQICVAMVVLRDGLQPTTVAGVLVSLTGSACYKTARSYGQHAVPALPSHEPSDGGVVEFGSGWITKYMRFSRVSRSSDSGDEAQSLVSSMHISQPISTNVKYSQLGQFERNLDPAWDTQLDDDIS